MTTKRITKATVKAALKGLDVEGLTIELDSETAIVWYNESGKDYETPCEEREAKASAVVDAIRLATGVKNVSGNGAHFRVNYKSEPMDMGDFNDPSSRWHY